MKKEISEWSIIIWNILLVLLINGWIMIEFYDWKDTIVGAIIVFVGVIIAFSILLIGVKKIFLLNKSIFKFTLIGVLITLIVLIIIPAIIYLFFNSFFNKEQAQVWLGFWGSYLGGIIGAIGVIVTTYFLIKSSKEEVKDSADIHDDKERVRYLDQLMVIKGEDTILKLSELKDRLEGYERMSRLLKRDISNFTLVIKGGESKEKDRLENNIKNSISNNQKSLSEIELKINQVLVILKTRNKLYKDTKLNSISDSIKKITTDT